MPIIVNLSVGEFRNSVVGFHYWRAEYDGIEGLGQTPQSALEEFRDAKRVLDPRDKRIFVLPSDCNRLEVLQRSD